MFLEYLKLSFLMIRARPVRSALSWLGIYIGMLAIIVILAIQAGVRRDLDDLYQTQGARVVLVHPGFDQATKRIGRLSLTDVNTLKLTSGVLSVLPRLQDNREVRSEKAVENSRIVGIDENFISIYRVPILQGRVFLPQEVTTKQPVCMLTRQTAEALFPFSEAVNRTIEIQGIVYQIVGVTDWDVAISQRSMMEDPQVLLPAPWLLKQGTDFISTLEVRVILDITPQQAVDVVTQALTRGDPSRSKLYSIITSAKFLEKKKAMSEQTLYSLLAIAAISLLVGGIGIANVMLTSVTERTREVGIRKALGATRWDILFQFLVEAGVLCASGGFAAVFTGWAGIGVLTAFFPGKFAVATPLIPTTVCLGLTLLVGLIAGLYPASRAAALSPAEALRYE